MIRQSNWQSENECGTCMMVLWHILALLCEVLSVTRIVTDGYCDMWALFRKLIDKYVAMERLIPGNHLITEHGFSGYGK
jgi:hypothetical protein